MKQFLSTCLEADRKFEESDGLPTTRMIIPVSNHSQENSCPIISSTVN